MQRYTITIQDVTADELDRIIEKLPVVGERIFIQPEH